MTNTLNVTARAEQAESDRQLMREVLLELRAERAHSTDLFHQAMSQNRNGVLETGVGKINADGWFYRDFRAPYAAVAIANSSVGNMTVSSAAPGPYAPTGPGSGLITAGSFQVVNLTGENGALTIYGTAGSIFTYSIFTTPQPPVGGALAAADAFGHVSTTIYGKSTLPGDTAVVVDAQGRLIVTGTDADNADAVATKATSIVRVAAEMFSLNSSSSLWERVRSGLGGRILTHTGTISNTSLNAATVTGVGGSVDLVNGFNSYCMTTVVTGAPATINVNLEGSMDGVTWYVLGASTSVTGDLQAVQGKPVRFIRANLTVLTGGAAPTVTARLMAAG